MKNRDIRAYKILFWILFPLFILSFIQNPSLKVGAVFLLFTFVLAPVIFNVKKTHRNQIDSTTEEINLTSKDWLLFVILGFILPLIATLLSGKTTTFASLFLFGVFSFIGVITVIAFLAIKSALNKKP